MNANRRAKKMMIEEIKEFLKGFLEEDVHAKRIFFSSFEVILIKPTKLASKPLCN